MAKDLNIGQNAILTIEWNVRPVDFSREKELNIIETAASKYGIPKEHVKVVPNFITLNTKGEEVALTNDTIQNIQDPKFQQHLFKVYLDENGIDDYDFDELVKIDSQINSLIDYEVYDKSKRYEIKWIRWSNFLSYGDDNFFDFTQLNGLVLLNGEPANQSGKSTFAYDLLHFVLFGKTTSGKADVLSDIFNRYRPETTEVKVEGCICIDNEDYIIRRTLTRPALKKRTAKSKTTQKVEYFKIVGGVEQELEDIDNLEASNNTATSKVIKEALGNEKDFDLVICANADNLKSLISLKDTERGRLLSKWIGLLPLEEKDTIAREKWNKEISRTLYSNSYNRDTLKAEIDAINLTIEENCKEIERCDVSIKTSDEKIKSFNEEKETLLSAKGKVDETLLKIDVHTLETQIVNITNKGKETAELKKLKEQELSEIGDVNFSENDYQDAVTEKEKLIIDINTSRSDIYYLRNENKRLTESEYCPTCKRKLEGVDYSETINENKTKELKLIENGIELNKKLDSVKEKIVKMDENRKLFNEKNRLSLLIDKYNADLELLRAQLKEKKQIFKNLEANKTIIEANNKIDASLRIVNVNLQTEEGIKNSLIHRKATLENENKVNKKNISDRETMIAKINEEEVLVKHWKIYLALVGKNGISKMVLRETLPLINGELRRLLTDVCDFDVEVVIDERNDVAFNLVRNGVVTNLASGSGFEQTAAALALRVVLGNISALSRPSLLLLDEVLGGVAQENYENIKLLFDRIIKDYSAVLHITHLNQIIDWHSSIVTITKKNHISSISHTLK
jgi:DNA repair exonuclease SbcCD ATPase subunit